MPAAARPLADLPLRGPAGRVARRGRDDARRRDFYLHAAVVLAGPPNPQVVRELWRLCGQVLFRLIVEQQWASVAAWFLWTVHQGVEPMRAMAESVIATFRRAFATPAPGRPARPRQARGITGFEQEVALRMARVAAIVRKHVLQEIEVRAALCAFDSLAEDRAPDGERRLLELPRVGPARPPGLPEHPLPATVLPFLRTAMAEGP
jgi:hypothetical protein